MEVTDFKWSRYRVIFDDIFYVAYFFNILIPILQEMKEKRGLLPLENSKCITVSIVKTTYTFDNHFLAEFFSKEEQTAYLDCLQVMVKFIKERTKDCYQSTFDQKVQANIQFYKHLAKQPELINSNPLIESFIKFSKFIDQQQKCFQNEEYVEFLFSLQQFVLIQQDMHYTSKVIQQNIDNSFRQSNFKFPVLDYRILLEIIYPYLNEETFTKKSIGEERICKEK